MARNPRRPPNAAPSIASSKEMITSGGMEMIGFPPTMSGQATNATAGMTLDISASRTSSAAESGGADGKGGSSKARETVDIDFDGFEQRAMIIPVPRGTFGNMEVNDKNHLLYARFPLADGQPAIMAFDLEDEKKEEKEILKGTGAFTLSADGLFRPDTVERLRREHLRGSANHSHILWALVVFHDWRRRWAV